MLDARETYNAQLGSEDGKEKHFLVDYDEISWFYAQSRGIKPEQKLYLEIRKVIKGTDPLLLYQDNVKADESGVIRQKIVWNNINNKINFLTVYAMVRENDKNGKVLYDADGSFSMATSNLLKNSILMKLPINKSAVMVEGSSIKPSESKSQCPNCDKPVTVEELKKIFTQADDATLKKAAEAYTKYMKELGMNTCWNKAHFFAQARVESGLGLHVKDGENFNWYYKSLIDTFSAFRSVEGKRKANDWGRPEILPKHPGVSIENQKNIANWAYSPNFAKGKELGNTDSDDGWNFRGKGLIQLTGRSAYDYANTYTKKENADIISNPDLVLSNITVAVVSSMAFWKWKKLNTKSNLTRDVISKICPSVGNDVPMANGKSNYEEKQKAFTNTTSVVFKIDECKFGKGNNASSSDGKYKTNDNSYQADSKTAYINIIVPKDRRSEGLLVFFDNTGIIMKSYALAMGTTNNAIFIPEGKGSTPKGLWSSWHEKVHIGETSYGDYGLIKVAGLSGDAKTATEKGRAGIAIHCGHTNGNAKGIYNDDGSLMFTYGCIRVYNSDMKTLVEKYNEVQNRGNKINVYVEEVDSIDSVFSKYDFIADPKDQKRNYSKNAKQ